MQKQVIVRSHSGDRPTCNHAYFWLMAAKRDSSTSCQKEASFFCGSKRISQEQRVCIKRKCKWLGRRDELQREAEAPKIDWKRNLPAGSMPASLIVQAAGNTV